MSFVSYELVRAFCQSQSSQLFTLTITHTVDNTIQRCHDIQGGTRK